jgi:hypothetical protein
MRNGRSDRRARRELDRITFCYRAMGLMAARAQDALGEDEHDWLLAHLACCPSCRIREKAMSDAELAAIRGPVRARAAR